MIISQTVPVALNGRNLKHFENLGYEIPRYLDKKNRWSFKEGTKIEVKVSDLTKGSNTKILCKCNECGKEFYLSYENLCRRSNPNICKICCSSLQGQKCKGQTLSKSTRKKISKSRKGKYSKENHPNWKGGNNHCKSCNKLLSKRNINLCHDCYMKILINPNKNELHKYRNKVNRETRKNKKALFENWDGLDYYTGENITDLPKRDITVDHRVSVFYGFQNQISPKEIGRLDNLCVCSRSTNSSKNFKNEVNFKSIC